MANVFIKRTRALQTINQVKAHAKYVGFRSKELKEKGFFGRDTDHADMKSFIERIENHKSLKHEKAIKAQKLIFSLKQYDYEAYKRSGKDYKDLVRATLKEYELKNNVKLDWIANIHEADGHPHVHVIIKGVSDTKDADGKYKRIYFKKEDFKDMKENFNREFERDAVPLNHEKFDMNKTLKDIGKGFEQVTNRISRDIEKEQMKAEREKYRDIKKQSRELKKRIYKSKQKDKYDRDR